MTSIPAGTTSKQALDKLKSACAQRELCISDAVRKMNGWKVDKNRQEGIIKNLIKEKYIDEDRYALAFVKDKHNLDGWGRIKIRYELSRKGIKAPEIQKALRVIEEDNYRTTLEKLIINKLKQLDKTDPETALIKLYHYAASKGYEQEVIERAIGQLLNKEP